MKRYFYVAALSSLVFSVALLVSGPMSVYAQGGTNLGGDSGGTTLGGDSAGSARGGLENPLKGIDTLPQFLTAILKGVVQIGTIILTMMLVYVGFLFVVAQGNPEKLQGAKSALVWTVIGGLVLLGATTIQLVIEGTVKSIT